MRNSLIIVAILATVLLTPGFGWAQEMEEAGRQSPPAPASTVETALPPAAPSVASPAPIAVPVTGTVNVVGTVRLEIVTIGKTREVTMYEGNRPAVRWRRPTRSYSGRKIASDVRRATRDPRVTISSVIPEKALKALEKKLDKRYATKEEVATISKIVNDPLTGNVALGQRLGAAETDLNDPKTGLKTRIGKLESERTDLAGFKKSVESNFQIVYLLLGALMILIFLHMWRGHNMTVRVAGGGRS